MNLRGRPAQWKEGGLGIQRAELPGAPLQKHPEYWIPRFHGLSVYKFTSDNVFLYPLLLSHWHVVSGSFAVKANFAMVSSLRIFGFLTPFFGLVDSVRFGLFRLSARRSAPGGRRTCCQLRRRSCGRRWRRSHGTRASITS